LIYLPNNVITAIYTVSHQKKKTSQSTLYLRIFFSFTDNKTGAIGIDIKFSSTTADDYQLIAYATFPKVAVIDNTGSCQLVDA
jgi:hypothetical protein